MLFVRKFSSNIPLDFLELWPLREIAAVNNNTYNKRLVHKRKCDSKIERKIHQLAEKFYELRASAERTPNHMPISTNEANAQHSKTQQQQQ